MTATLPEQLTGPDGLAVRDFTGMQLRAETREDGARTVTGLGVPYGEEYETPWFRERFEPGAITDDSAALAYYRHIDPIGRVTASKDIDAGREVTLTLSRTSTADEAHTLAQDGVIRGLSVGFVPVKWREEHDEGDERPLIVHESVQVREYSLVPFPAYAGAQIASVRSTDHHRSHQEDTMPTATEDLVTRAEHDETMTEVRAAIEDVTRRVASAGDPTPADMLAARAEQFATIGDYVQAITSEGDPRHEVAMLLHRDITTSDIPSHLVNTPGFIGDLSKKVTERRRWLSRFNTRSLPRKGMTVDYIKTTATATVAEQEEQLEELAKGAGFTVTAASSPVRTFGGAETVARQVIDRSEAWALTTMFEAFALQYARQTEAATKAYIVAQAATKLAGTAGTDYVEVPAAFGAFDWIDSAVDSAGLLDDRGYDLQALAVSADVFKRLASEAGTDGRPLLTVSGSSTGVNVVGTANLPGLSGELLRIPVAVLNGAAAGTALFYDPVAIETLESPGAPFWLQADGVLNLSRDYACYGYIAHIAPHPGALLPVSFTGTTTPPED